MQVKLISYIDELSIWIADKYALWVRYWYTQDGSLRALAICEKRVFYIRSKLEPQVRFWGLVRVIDNRLTIYPDAISSGVQQASHRRSYAPHVGPRSVSRGRLGSWWRVTYGTCICSPQVSLPIVVLLLSAVILRILRISYG